MDHMKPYKRLVILNLVLTIIVALAFWGTVITALVIKSWTLLYIVPIVWVGGMSVVIGMRIWLSVVKERCMRSYYEKKNSYVPVVLTEEEKASIDTIMNK